MTQRAGVGETAANHIDWKLITIVFDCSIWRDLSWQLYLPFVISPRHRLHNLQPIALKRTIDDLARNYRVFCAYIRQGTQRCERGSDLVCRNHKTGDAQNIWERIQSDALYTHDT